MRKMLYNINSRKTIPKVSGLGNGTRTVMRYFYGSVYPGAPDTTTGACIEDFICVLRAAATSLLDSIQKFLGYNIPRSAMNNPTKSKGKSIAAIIAVGEIPVLANVCPQVAERKHNKTAIHTSQ